MSVLLRKVSGVRTSVDDYRAWLCRGDCFPLFFPGASFSEEEAPLLWRQSLDVNFVCFGLAYEGACRVMVEANVCVFCTEYVVFDGALQEHIAIVRDTIVLG